MASPASLKALCRSNIGILSQKLSLIDALIAKFGRSQAFEMYKSPCPTVGASVGQHIRHSMDHMELAVIVAGTYTNSEEAQPQLHYDLRVRGGTLEHDMDEASKRLTNVSAVLEELAEQQSEPDNNNLLSKPVQANFMLSGADGDEFGLASTVGRELGFAAHHAIHHMAMIKLIALGHIGLDGTDLPSDFGKAPSTIHHDRSSST